MATNKHGILYSKSASLALILAPNVISEDLGFNLSYKLHNMKYLGRKGAANNKDTID